MARIIFHIDMNSFFVSCEVAENPELYGKNVAVAPNASSRKSIILAASYQAKAKGVKTTMHINEALRVCPDLILVESKHHLYSEYSRKFFSYFLSITPLVEPASIDEGYLDVTDLCKNENPIDLAVRIQKEILEKFSLPCSIGIAPNKFLAKMASDMKKPLGITILRKREIKDKMWILPIGDLQGVGKKTVPLLKELKINTIGDLANFKNIKMLEETIGKNVAHSLIAHANGEGSSIVDVNRFNDAQSVSNSTTFDADEYDVDKVKVTLKALTHSVCNRLEKTNVKAMTFTVQIKYNNFKMYSKSKTLDTPINDFEKVYLQIEDLFDDLHDLPFGIRLVGVGASKLKPFKEKQKQLTIFDSFDENEKDIQINKLIRQINEELGSELLKIGVDKKSK
ncbi:MAG: DNA polymerase IV [Bacilli bacterium]|nr:DNA polymerase IV [Bacilli bacterium]